MDAEGITELELHPRNRQRTRNSSAVMTDMRLSRTVAGALIIVALVVGVVIGFLSGYYGPGAGIGTTVKHRLSRDAAEGVRKKLLGEINGGNIRRNLR